MGKYEKKDKPTKKVGICVCLAILLFLALLIMIYWVFWGDRQESDSGQAAKGNDQELVDTAKQNETESSTTFNETDPFTAFMVLENENNMVVQTKYFELKIPNTFAEVIEVSAIDYSNRYALEFNAKTLSESVPIYTVWIGHETGIVLGMLSDNGTNEIVSVELHNPPNWLSESELNTFYAAQETVNDVTDELYDLILPYDAEENNNETHPQYVGSGNAGDEAASESNPSFENRTSDFSIKEHGNMIDIVTEFGIISYPLAFEEILEVIPEETSDGYVLHFNCLTEAERIPAYSLWFNSERGTLAGNIVNSANRESTVSIEYYDAPIDLSEDEMDIFYAAQETMNDIIYALQNTDKE